MYSISVDELLGVGEPTLSVGVAQVDGNQLVQLVLARCDLRLPVPLRLFLKLSVVHKPTVQLVHTKWICRLPAHFFQFLRHDRRRQAPSVPTTSSEYTMLDQPLQSLTN